jgi:hypothetical protein
VAAWAVSAKAGTKQVDPVVTHPTKNSNPKPMAEYSKALFEGKPLANRHTRNAAG